ncbi:MAG: helix-turn-helix domain-containing protein [Alphaproteobacteria bacterium]|nr:MAG: helix-turn-helix domain-containing protein [Alphaproteobacteria bacterium]
MEGAMSVPAPPERDDAADAEALGDVLHCESIAARISQAAWSFSAHRHRSLHQIFWVTKGAGRVTLDGVPQGFGPNTLIFVPALCVHGFAFGTGAAGWIVTVPAALHLAVPRRPQLLRLTGAADPVTVTGMISTLAEEHAQMRPARAEMLLAQAGILAVWITRAALARPAPRETARRRLMRRFCALLEERFHEHLQVDAYAAALSVTPTHLTRVCREVAGVSASSLIQDRTLLEARRLLAQGGMKVAAIARALGFNDPAYFTRVFTARTGHTPTGFRATARRTTPRGPALRPAGISV